jgi:predicted nucleic acid-binding protein
LVDLGEASAIKYCLENKKSLLVIDDNKGRKLAKRMGLTVTGTLGVIAKAKKVGLLPAVKSYLELLEKVEFRFDEKLKKVILNSAGE